MSGHTDFKTLKYPTSDCANECQGFFGYCPVHEQAHLGPRGDYIIGPEEVSYRIWEDRPPPLYITTRHNPYVCIEEWKNGKGIIWWRGSYCTKELATINSVGYDTQLAGNHQGGTMFGVENMRLYLVGVGSRVWNY